MPKRARPTPLFLPPVALPSVSRWGTSSVPLRVAFRHVSIAHPSPSVRRARPYTSRPVLHTPRATAQSQPSPPHLTPRVAQSSLSALASYFGKLSHTYPFLSRRLALALVCIISSKLVGICVPLLFQRAVDSLLASPTETAFRTAAGALMLHCAARIFASTAHELRNAAFARAGQRMGRVVTAETFRHLHGLEVAFHNACQTGALTRIVDRGTRAVMTISRALLFSFMPTLFELSLVACVLVRKFSVWYLGVTVAMFVTFIAWTFWINDRLGRIRAAMNTAENEASAKLTDSLINVEAVKSFSNEFVEYSRYDEALWRYENVAIRNEWLFTTLNIGQGLIFTLGLTAILLRAAASVSVGTLSVGSMVMLGTMLQQLWVPLNFLGWQYREVKQSLIDVQNLFDVLKREAKVVDGAGATPLIVGGGEIRFESVCFEYPEMEEGMMFTRKSTASVVHGDAAVPTVRRRALDNLSFSVPAGKSVALVGSSGSGKSTATRLLYRLYDLTDGKILIDGQDISKATISSLRQSVSIVPQDTALFNDTIAYNIRYGRPTATDEEVIGAAKAASIHEVIMRTPQGYETMVGERGVRLSGGERQRLSVARAYLKGSKIIVEDESTSALDTLTELAVSRALEKLGMNRTRIIVAHRLSTIMNVDEIVVMQYGRKVEQGSFEELVLRRNGVFRGMWERQQKKEHGGRLENGDLANEIGELIDEDEEEHVELGRGARYEGEQERRGREDDMLTRGIVDR